MTDAPTLNPLTTANICLSHDISEANGLLRMPRLPASTFEGNNLFPPLAAHVQPGVH